MPKIQGAPYKDERSTQRWDDWFRNQKKILESISVSIGNIDDVTLTSVGDNELLTYDSGTAKWINETLTEFGIVNDTTPQLGGDLDLNSNDIVDAGSGARILLGDGSAGLPSYGFANDLDTGMSLLGVGALRIGTGNTTGLRVTNAYVRVGFDGSPTIPCLQIGADADTGLYQSANNVLDVAAGGVRIGSWPTVTSAVNYMQHDASVAGTPIGLTAAGSDTDIGILLAPKGAGVVDVEAPLLATSTMDAEGVATFNAATHVIVGNATVEGSLLAMAESTDEWILTFNSGTETWEGQANAASAAEHSHTIAEVTDITAFGASIIDDANTAAFLITTGLTANLASFVIDAGSTTISAYGASIIDDVDNEAALATLGAASAEHAHVAAEITDLTIEDNSDVVITTVATEELLQWSGTEWINQTLAEAGVSAAEHAHEAAEIDDGVAVFGAAEHSHTSGEVSGLVTELEGLDNVTTEVMGVGQDEHVLTWNDTAEVWEDQASAAGATELEGLDNVTTEVMGAGQDEHVLTWNDASEVWEDQAAAAGGTGDLLISTTAPTLEFSDTTASSDDFRIVIDGDVMNIEADEADAETFATEVLAFTTAGIRAALPVDAEGLITAAAGISGTTAVFTSTGDIEGNAILGGTVDVEGIATFAAAPVFASTVDVEGALAANAGITGTTATFTSTGDIEGAATLGSTVDVEGVMTQNAATAAIVGNLTVETSLLALAETTDEFVLTFNAGTETWEGQVAAGGDKVYRLSHTHAVAGTLAVQSGQANYIIPFAISLAAGQTADLVAVRHSVGGGTCEVKVQRNGIDLGGTYAEIAVSTSFTTTDTADTEIADEDDLTVVIESVSGADNLMFSYFIEYSQ